MNSYLKHMLYKNKKNYNTKLAIYAEQSKKDPRNCKKVSHDCLIVGEMDLFLETLKFFEVFLSFSFIKCEILDRQLGYLSKL